MTCPTPPVDALRFEDMPNAAEVLRLAAARLESGRGVPTPAPLLRRWADELDATPATFRLPAELAAARRNAFADGMDYAIGLPAPDETLPDPVLDWIEGIAAEIRAGQRTIPRQPANTTEEPK
jgi:hypothetical protein